MEVGKENWAVAGCSITGTHCVPRLNDSVGQVCVKKFGSAKHEAGRKVAGFEWI